MQIFQNYLISTGSIYKEVNKYVCVCVCTRIGTTRTTTLPHFPFVEVSTQKKTGAAENNKQYLQVHVPQSSPPSTQTFRQFDMTI